MAPEVILGDAIVIGERDESCVSYGSRDTYNESCDVYSFGLLLWEIMQQKIPFEGLEAMAAAYLASTGERPPLDLLPCRDVASLIQRCWSQDPTRRCEPCRSHFHR